MIKKISLLYLFLILCLCICACSQKEEGEKVTAESAPETSSSSEEDILKFSAVDLEGNTVTDDIFSNADLTVVNFWATFCGPCINEMPELAEWSEAMPDNVQIIGIISDVRSEDSQEYTLAKEIVDKTGATYVNLIAANEFDGILQKIVGVPTTYFADKSGKFVGSPIVGADVAGYKDFVEGYLDGLESGASE